LNNRAGTAAFISGSVHSADAMRNLRLAALFSSSTRNDDMFVRQRKLQYNAKPDRPDPIFAKMLQEPLGGQWGEISVMMTYLFQGWSCRAPGK
jgi:hypothetical protein